MQEPPLIPAELLKHATVEELALYENHLTVQKALRSPLDYALHCSPERVLSYAHTELLNEYLVALFEGRLYKSGPGPAPEGYGDDARHPVTGEKPVDQLAISMPPRHGKSLIVSEHLPAYLLTRFPTGRVILASYESDFAAEWGRKARNLVEAHPEFGVHVDQTSRAADHWSIMNTAGEMKTAGAGGPITGSGATLAVIIDDPLKNDEDARSDTIRGKQKDWLVATVDSRREKNPITGRPAPVLLMATRWHEDDLIGWQTKNHPGKWCVLNLPALAFDDEDDPLNREPGAALCPDLFTAIQLEEKRSNGDETGQGERWFNALYQGRPYTDGAGIFKRSSFLYYSSEENDSGDRLYRLTRRDGSTVTVHAHDCFRFQTIDLAATTKSSSDWTVISTWDVTKDHDLILVDRIRERMESADHASRVLAEFVRLKPRFIGVEKATYGLTLIQTLLRSGKPVRELKPDKDKFSRAIPAGDWCDNGKVFFPRGAKWLKEWEDELIAFDSGTHDDQVDTIAYAVKVLQSLPHGRSLKAPEGQTAEDKIARMQARMDRKHTRRSRHPELGRL